MSSATTESTNAAVDGAKDTTAPPQVEVSEHPVLQHKLALIRRQEGTAKEFRTLFREITFYLGYEATRDLTTKSIRVKTDVVEKCPARKIAEKVAVVPILRQASNPLENVAAEFERHKLDDVLNTPLVDLRFKGISLNLILVHLPCSLLAGGLGMTEALLELLPDSPVYHVGMYRNPSSLIPVQYYNRLPKGNPSDVALVLDPIIASSRTITAVVSIVKKWGAKKIKVVTLVASRSGLEVLCNMHPEVQVYLASIDELAENGLDLVPGIGDPGDRLYLGASKTNACSNDPNVCEKTKAST